MQGRTEPTYKQLRSIFDRLADTTSSPTETSQELLEELSELVEELGQADKQLRVQNMELTEARQSLEEERRRYMELFDFAPDTYLITDLNGVITEANQPASSMLNVGSVNLIGKSLAFFVDQSDWSKIFSLLHESAHLNDVELHLQPHDQQRLVASATIALMRDAIGQPVGVRWLLHDITRRKAMEAELEEMHRHLQGGNEAERQRLAQQIHDGPMQDLYGAVFQLNLWKELIDNADLLESLQDVEDTIKHAASTLRM